MILETLPQKEDFNANACFSKMKRLQLIKISNVPLPQGLDYISNELRMMEWHDYPLKSMPRSFRPNNLVELIMPHSHIKQLPEGFSVRFSLKQVFFFLLRLSSLILNFSYLLLLFCHRIWTS